jgi:hypothetical protein
MTHDELLEKINQFDAYTYDSNESLIKALRKIVKLHQTREQVTGMNSTGQILSTQTICSQCSEGLGAYATVYPCPTIQAIEKELS